jgi:hypothetical protein
MSFPQIPASILQQGDRKAVFEGIRSWMQHELQAADINQPDALLPAPLPSTTCWAVVTHPGASLKLSNQPLPAECRASSTTPSKGLAASNTTSPLIDGPNQFDPQSAASIHLQCLLWVRPTRPSDILQACDILIRDGNFPLVLLDLRSPIASTHSHIRPNEWYRLQRVCEHSRVAFVSFTTTSTIPCAHFRLQLTRHLPLSLLELPSTSALSLVQCDILKRRRWVDTEASEAPNRQVVNSRNY